MKIYEIIWDDDNIEHIARHNVVPEEVEEVCFSSSSVVEKARISRKSYFVLGQTHAGRFLLVVAKYYGKNKARVITARDMAKKEKIRYKNRRKR